MKAISLDAPTKGESALRDSTGFNSDMDKCRKPKSGNHGAFNQLVAEVFRQPILTQHQEMHLIQQAKAGDQQAREKLIRSNLRYAVSLAYKLRGYLSDKTLLEDLFGEGVKGLMEAVDRFDIQRNNRFITYAYWWMQKMMKAYIHREKQAVSSIKQRFEESAVEDQPGNSTEDTIFDAQDLTPEIQAQKQAFLELFQDIISEGEFSEKERVCLKATLLEGKSTSQIELEQGIKSNTVKSHIFRAKDKLLRSFQERGITAETILALI